MVLFEGIAGQKTLLEVSFMLDGFTGGYGQGSMFQRPILNALSKVGHRNGGAYLR